MNLHISREKPNFWSVFMFLIGRPSPIRRVDTELSEQDLLELLSIPLKTDMTPAQILASAQTVKRSRMTPEKVEDAVVTFLRAREQLQNGTFKPQETHHARSL